MSVEQHLQHLKQRELDKLENKEKKIKEKYDRMPDTVERVAQLLDLPEGQVIQASVSAAWHYQNLEWDDVMDIVRYFHLAIKHLNENEEDA